ncbi:unnamed protein product [Blepharisma stoltei]|uniref:Uncharacterized protein n=1 Tax=Blepharisma stoltei TaxID=1481888 RepID=A0AAU9J068_9CILI|nr:unnamed protein product [Blepharisma stoltei]
MNSAEQLNRFASKRYSEPQKYHQDSNNYSNSLKNIKKIYATLDTSVINNTETTEDSVGQHSRSFKESSGKKPQKAGRLVEYNATRYTINLKKSKKKILRKNYDAHPGPGAYSIQPVLSKSPRATIGKAKRWYLSRNSDNPGPGTYEDSLLIKLKHPDYSFTMTSRDGFVKAVTPGPGSYNTSKSTNDGKPALIIPRRPQSAAHSTPGPGAYSSKTTKSTSPKWTIGKSQRYQNNYGRYPSPAEYSPKGALEAAPAYSMGKSQKQDTFYLSKKDLEVEYFPKEKVSYGKSSTTVKTHFTFKSEAPGPGQYFPNSEVVLKKSPKAAFGTSTRF